MATIKIDPITRIEGHLAVRVEVESNRITKAYSSGEMFRGFEILLKGRDPLDAQQITQRICGVCPVSHGTASVLAQDQAYGLSVPDNGRLLRNLILAADYIHSHILHFYHLCALDFVDIGAVTAYKGKEPSLVKVKEWVLSQVKSEKVYPAAPFLPRYESAYLRNAEANFVAIKNYVEGLEMRRLAHEMGAIFAGKMPHAASLVPGGMTEQVTSTKIAAYAGILDQLRTFIDNAYLPDVLAVAQSFPDYFAIGKGCGNFMSYGVFPEGSGQWFPSGVLMAGQLSPLDPSKIAEEVGSSRFSSATGLHPKNGETVPSPSKSGAYSWIKSPRYGGEPMEVGALARVLVAYHAGMPEIKKPVDELLGALKAPPTALVSVMGRHAARAIECKLIAERCVQWLDALRPDKPSFTDFKIPDAGSGAGLTEAPRGALGHWITVKGGRIENYQCVVPTTWNCSPRDDRGQCGPVEQALVGTPVADAKNPIEASRVVRSFDPCIACAVH